MLVDQQYELLVSGPVADTNMYQITVLFSGEPFSMMVETALVNWTDSRKAAALALVVWDALITLDNEVDHIWS